MLSDKTMSSYIRKTIDKYEEDNTIFEKAINIIKLYMQKPEWPHCIDELNKYSENITGLSFLNLTYLTGKFIDSGEANWDGVPSTFKNDFLYFYNSIGKTYNQAWEARLEPHGYHGISFTINDIGRKIVLKIMKNNNESLELELNGFQLDSLIKNLQQLKGNINGRE